MAVSVASLVACMPAHTIKLFLTDLLFSSLQLQFSVPQKKAVLQRALQLGTPGIPTFHALSQSQDYIKGLIGDSVMAATTGMGHKIFIQDVPYMMAKVCLGVMWTHRH
jgi:hypothetical protein